MLTFHYDGAGLERFGLDHATEHGRRGEVLIWKTEYRYSGLG